MLMTDEQLQNQVEFLYLELDNFENEYFEFNKLLLKFKNNICNSQINVSNENYDDYIDLENIKDYHKKEIFDETIDKLKNIFLNIYKRLGSITTKIFKILRNGSERVLFNSTKVLDLWYQRLNDNLNKIDENVFLYDEVISCNYDEYKKRLKCVNVLINIINNVSSIINKDNFQADVVLAIKQIRLIGFNITSYNFLKNSDEEYKNKIVKDTVKNHGFTLNKLNELLEHTKYMTKYSSKDYINKINKQFSDIYNDLVKQENIIESSTDKNKVKLLNELNTKISNLYWVSLFISTVFQISNDTINQIYQIYKVADNSISED